MDQVLTYFTMLSWKKQYEISRVSVLNKISKVLQNKKLSKKRRMI